MAKRKFTPRGPLSTAEKPSIPKGDPKKLRMRAEELKLKSARLMNEADELIAKAEQIERAKHPHEDFSQAAARGCATTLQPS